MQLVINITSDHQEERLKNTTINVFFTYIFKARSRCSLDLDYNQAKKKKSRSLPYKLDLVFFYYRTGVYLQQLFGFANDIYLMYFDVLNTNL